MIDFTDCKRVRGRAYNGANGKKIAVLHNDEIYMIKFPPPPTQKGVELSYANSCLSEHICSRIFESVGIKSQETMLGTFTINGKEKIVCACKDFTTKDKSFFDFASIKNTVIDSETSGRGMELSSIIESIELQESVSATMLMDFYFEMFIVDSLIGNFDRHNGNFGLLYDAENDNYEIAPVYDCGSCLLPQADDEKLRFLLNSRGEFNSRIYNFPLSAIKQNDKKINYHDFITSCENPHCNSALKRVMPSINISAINAIIDNTEPATDTKKEFYKAYIKARYDKILVPALEKLQ